MNDLGIKDKSVTFFLTDRIARVINKGGSLIGGVFGGKNVDFESGSGQKKIRPAISRSKSHGHLSEIRSSKVINNASAIEVPEKIPGCDKLFCNALRCYENKNIMEFNRIINEIYDKHDHITVRRAGKSSLRGYLSEVLSVLELRVDEAVKSNEKKTLSIELDYTFSDIDDACNEINKKIINLAKKYREKFEFEINFSIGGVEFRPGLNSALEFLQIENLKRFEFRNSDCLPSIIPELKISPVMELVLNHCDISTPGSIASLTKIMASMQNLGTIQLGPLQFPEDTEQGHVLFIQLIKLLPSLPHLSLLLISRSIHENIKNIKLPKARDAEGNCIFNEDDLARLRWQVEARQM
ncbi:hypothetical protein [Paraburkholderia bonniea]|uniref:hypothetical protein n=1 Tax=Paraburkholderia bonniea TaxID=2152891 RepID=UPI0012911F0A|nr:hypothetical protein [Paraburkholderia bonniea]